MNESPRFYKFVVWTNCAVPALLLGWDALRGRLGVNPVNDAIRTTGMMALVLLVLALAITPLRRLTRWHHLIAARRPLGLAGFYYASTHLALYVVGDRALDLGSTLDEFATRRYLQFGLIALLLMVPLAVTSTDAMVRRLGGTRWKRLHRLAYLAIAAGVVHYYLLVKADVRLPLTFAAVVAALLLLRVANVVANDYRRRGARAAPVKSPRATRASYRGALVVADIVDETADVKTFRLVAPGGGALPFTHRPGQYLTLQQQIDGQTVQRCYTIASSPSRTTYCEITVKREQLGMFTRLLHERVRCGDSLLVRAPAGRFVFDGRGTDRVVLIAGGVGITPLMSIVRYLTDTGWPGQIDLIVAARTRGDLIFHDELTRLASRFANLRVYRILSRETANAGGATANAGGATAMAYGRLSLAALQQWIQDWATVPVYLCGPAAMMEAVKQVLRELGTPAHHIHTEAFVSPSQPERWETDPQPANPAVLEARIQFSSSGRDTRATAQRTVLEVAEEAGVAIPFECRSGICGQCKVRLIEGRVHMDAAHALTSSERQAGWILACQSRALRNLVLDA